MFFPASSARVQRLIRILSSLNAGSTLNAIDLAQTFEVSRRTVFRDIQFLREAGVDIVFDEQRNAYSVARENPVPTNNLSRDEMALIVLALKSSPIQANPALAAAGDEALAKLLVGREAREAGELTHLASKCGIGAADASQRNVDASIVLTVLRAIMLKRQIRIAQKPSGTETPIQTNVAPYHLVLDGEAWQFIGRSSIHRRNTRFDLQQIIGAELTGETFEPPPRPHRRLKSRNRQGAGQPGLAGS